MILPSFASFCNAPAAPVKKSEIAASCCLVCDIITIGRSADKDRKKDQNKETRRNKRPEVTT